MEMPGHRVLKKNSSRENTSTSFIIAVILPKAGGKQIGVAMADSPTGPFTDLGQPIITDSPVGHGQQIDVDVFTDPVSGKPLSVLGEWLHGRCRTE